MVGVAEGGGVVGEGDTEALPSPLDEGEADAANATLSGDSIIKKAATRHAMRVHACLIITYSIPPIHKCV
jgi:hypothetical protein